MRYWYGIVVTYWFKKRNSYISLQSKYRIRHLFRIFSAKTCPRLPTFANLRSIRYVRQNRKTNAFEDVKEPFQYDVRAYHTCEPGYEPYPTNVRMCHGRGSKTSSDWTAEVVCTRKNTLLLHIRMFIGGPCSEQTKNLVVRSKTVDVEERTALIFCRFLASW